MPQFDADRDAVLARMKEKGMGAVIIGTDFETSKAGLELATQHDFLWASVGLHPNDPEHFDISKYEELAQDPKAVAIGECGLDYFRSKPDGQKERFEAHIALAQKLNKALVIHCRNAHDDTLAMLISEQGSTFLKKVPAVETDAPFAAPAPFRGKRNEPVYVEHVAAKIAHIKGLTTEEVAARTAHNALAVFKLR